jgi:predicted acyl esterase
MAGLATPTVSIRILSVVLCLFLLTGPTPRARAAVEIQAGIGFIAVSGAAPGIDFALEDVHGNQVSGTTDAFGSLAFVELDQGKTYVLIGGDAPGGTEVKVLRFEDHPDASFYGRTTLVEGYQYIPMRDGTLLAAMVRAPLGQSLAQGPFPTVIEYSGYSPADPNNPQPSELIASALGYATVGVNMRGSGCSGGVIDLFDLPTTADGYDIVETVSAQSWVKGGKVGMVGISFPGITQLFVGGARPPHLAALAPLSTIGDIYRAPGFPGGIFNNGFAKGWLQERKRDAEPAPAGGQDWARKRAREGDAICLANQRLRLQTIDPIAFLDDHPYYEPERMDARSPVNWVGNIAVPTYYSASWQDEQTGGGFGVLLSRFPNRPDVKLTMQNGVHTSSLDPEVLFGWNAFLDLYVAKKVPNLTMLTAIAPIIYSMILEHGAPTPPLPKDPYVGITDYDAALKVFESQPHVRVRMENGGGSDRPGLPAQRFELGFSKWPVPKLTPTALYFGPHGTLLPRKPRSDQSGIDTFHPDPEARPVDTYVSGGDWDTIPGDNWAPLVGGTALAYATPPLANDVTIVGPSSVDLWLRSSAADTDLQVTLSEIRPDGLETYVQNGWLRASHRKLDRKRSTVYDPWVTHLEKDAAPMPAGKFTKVRIGTLAVAHLFRKGSRIRVSIEAPGGDRRIWRFETPETNGLTLDEISRTTVQPSRIVLPVVPGATGPEKLPPCPGLRGQLCRGYVAAQNGG